MPTKNTPSNRGSCEAIALLHAPGSSSARVMASMSADRSCDEHQNVAGAGVADPAGDHARVVDGLSGEKDVRRDIGQVVQVREHAILIDESTRAEATAERDAHHLTARVDGEGLGQGIVVERLEIDGLGAAFGPE